MSENQVIHGIMNRKSIRQFSGDAVSREDLDTILRAGMAAPSAMNYQPWMFLVIDNRELMDKIAEVHPYAKMLKTAGAAIIVCADKERFIKPPMTDFWVQDCSAVTQNILLAVEDLGLGAVWCGVYANPALADQFKSYLDLPENIIPFSLIPIGHPVGEHHARDKYDASRIHWNQW